MTTRARYVAPMVAGLAIFGGVAIAAGLVLTKPKTKRVAPPRNPPIVETVSVSAQSRPAVVEALGTLIAEQQVRLQPEVSGVVRKLHPALVPGGRVRKGAPLLHVDNRNYRIALEQARAQVAKAEVDLRLERGRQRVAKAEWDLLGGDTRGEADEELALRKPQVMNVEAALASAKSALERAQLDLSRTVLKAPFDAFVQEESVDLGQRVGPESPVATLIGTDAFWVQVSLPPSALSFVGAPSEGKPGSSVLVRSAAPGREVERDGRVIRVLGDLDPRGKMARVLVEVRDPLGLESKGSAPLLLGEVVKVQIEGRALDDVYAVPRLALRDGDVVWVAEQDKLSLRSVEVVWRGADEVFVRGSLGANPRVVTTRIATPVEGMPLRFADAKAKAEVR